MAQTHHFFAYFLYIYLEIQIFTLAQTHDFTALFLYKHKQIQIYTLSNALKSLLWPRPIVFLLIFFIYLLKSKSLLWLRPMISLLYFFTNIRKSKSLLCQNIIIFLPPFIYIIIWFQTFTSAQSHHISSNFIDIYIYIDNNFINNTFINSKFMNNKLINN